MKKKNKIQINIDLSTTNILNRFKTFVLKIITTSLIITKYILIAWLVFVLTTNAIAFLEITFSIFDEFQVNQWMIYKVYYFVEVTLGLGLVSNWIPVEEACSVILIGG
jgi:hypothetical protein